MGVGPQPAELHFFASSLALSDPDDNFGFRNSVPARAVYLFRPVGEAAASKAQDAN